MDEPYPAFHKAILGIDIEGFADRRRTNPDQIAVRAGLYRCLRTAFARSSIAWDSCYHEDRGDGALVLVPPEIPKAWLVTRFPRSCRTRCARITTLTRRRQGSGSGW
jgi:hypothetical protein